MQVVGKSVDIQAGRKKSNKKTLTRIIFVSSKSLWIFVNLSASAGSYKMADASSLKKTSLLIGSGKLDKAMKMTRE